MKATSIKPVGVWPIAIKVSLSSHGSMVPDLSISNCSNASRHLFISSYTYDTCPNLQINHPSPDPSRHSLRTTHRLRANRQDIMASLTSDRVLPESIIDWMPEALPFLTAFRKSIQWSNVEDRWNSNCHRFLRSQDKFARQKSPEEKKQERKKEKKHIFYGLVGPSPTLWDNLRQVWLGQVPSWV